jgi:subtilisin family serine protease
VSPQLAGVAPSSRLTIVKFYDFDGIWHTWLGDFLAGVDWVLAHRQTYRIRVLLAAVNWEIDGGLSAACQELLSAGILPVVAAGNGGVDQSPGFPALCTDALTVGAVNDAAAVAASSGRGDGPVIKPEIMAPGGGLLPESGRIMTTDNEPNDSYSPRRGTSLAAAHVAAGAFQVLEALGKEGHRRRVRRRSAC